MQFLTILALATTAAMAAATGNTATRNYNQCTPPSYVCKPDYSGWVVCNVGGEWLDGGSCPKGTTCKPINNLPYCI